MDDRLFWFLVFPLLVLAILYYVGFLTIGLSFVASAFKSGNPRRKIVLFLLGLGVIAGPFAASKIQRVIAERDADLRQERFANLDRIDLAGRLPRKFVTVGRYRQADIDFIKRRYGMSQFPDSENNRLENAYRQYRKAAFCNTHSSGKKLAPNVNISVCRDLPDSIQSALKINEPVLFFAEGSSTSYRRSNTLVGKMYEVRLVTRTEDLLVDYFEQRTVEDPAGITNPYSSGWKLDRRHKAPTMKEFIQTALEGASR